MENREQRGEPRINWRGSLRLVLPGEDPIEATIADISEMGCGLRAARAVPTGAEVGIDGNGFQGSGIVRHCYPHQGGFHLGIELLSPGA